MSVPGIGMTRELSGQIDEHSRVSVSVIESWQDVVALRNSWNELADAADPDNVFLTFEWLDSAWQWARADSTPWIVCVRTGDTLLGAAALLVRRRTWRGLPVRQVEFVTCPDTQSAGVLAVRGAEQRVASAVAETLRSRAGDWDRLLLRYLDCESGAAVTLAEALSANGITARLTADQGNPWVALDRSWEDYYATRSRRLKKGNNHLANRLGRRFDAVDVEHVTAGQGADAGPALEQAIGISAASWKGVTGNSLGGEGPEAFIRRLTQHSLEQGWLSLWLLRLDGVPAAMEYQLVYRGHVHALRSDYPESLAEFGPGRYLAWKILEASCGGALRRYWMGPGDNPYKARWAESEADLQQVMAFSPSARGRLLGAIHTGVACARSARDRCRRLLVKDDTR